MRLQVFIPSRMIVDAEVSKVVADSRHGSFCLLPRHIDYVAVLVTGILSYEESNSGREQFLAVDEGILIKRGTDVSVSARKAVGGADLGRLSQTIEEEFSELDEREAKTRTIIAKLESDFVRKAIEMHSA